MKMLPEHYTNLRAACFNALTEQWNGVTHLMEEYKGLSEDRMLFDLYHHSQYGLTQEKKVGNYTDNHLKTALKRIVNELSKN